MQKTFLLLFAALLLMPAALFAVDLSGDELPNYSYSPTKVSTMETFTSDFESYMDAIDWYFLPSNVLFLQYDTPSQSGPQQAQAGTGATLGGIYLGAFIGSDLPRTDADSESYLNTNSVVYDSNGVPVGKKESTTSNELNENLNDTDFDLLVGMELGEMILGVKNSLNLSQDDYSGTLDVPTLINTSWDAPLDAVGPGDSYTAIPFGTTTAVADSISTTVTDASGTATYDDRVTYHDSGYKEDSTLSDALQVGLQMPMGGFDLQTYIDIGFSMSDDSYKSGMTQSTTYYDDNYADYEGVENAASYTNETYQIDDSYSYLSPGLMINAVLPMSEKVIVEAGLDYDLSLRMGDPKSYSFSITNYAPSFDGTYLDTTTTVDTLSMEQETTDMTNTIGIPFKVEVSPSEKFRYAASYKPEIQFGAVENTYSGTITKTSTVVDGDPNVETVVTTKTGTVEGKTSTTETLELTHNLSLGAQFYLRENLRINIGSWLGITQINKTTTTVDAGDDSSYVETVQTGSADPVTTDSQYANAYASDVADSVTVTNDVAGGFEGVYYSLGMTYFFSENMELDLRYTGNAEYQNSEGPSGASIFSMGNWAALMTIRY